MQSGTVENSMELRHRTGAGMWKGIDSALLAFKVVTWLDPANRMVGVSLMDAVRGTQPTTRGGKPTRRSPHLGKDRRFNEGVSRRRHCSHIECTRYLVLCITNTL